MSVPDTIFVEDDLRQKVISRFEKYIQENPEVEPALNFKRSVLKTLEESCMITTGMSERTQRSIEAMLRVRQFRFILNRWSTACNGCTDVETKRTLTSTLNTAMKAAYCLATVATFYAGE